MLGDSNVEATPRIALRVAGRPGLAPRAAITNARAVRSDSRKLNTHIFCIAGNLAVYQFGNIAIKCYLYVYSLARIVSADGFEHKKSIKKWP